MSITNFPLPPARLATRMDDAATIVRALYTMLRDASESDGMPPDLARIGLDAIGTLKQQLAQAAEIQPGISDLCQEADRLLGQVNIAFLSAAATAQQSDACLPPTMDFYATHLPPMALAMTVLVRARRRLHLMKDIGAKAKADWNHLRPVV